MVGKAACAALLEPRRENPQQPGDLLNPPTTSLEAQKVATWHQKHGLLHVVQRVEATLRLALVHPTLRYCHRKRCASCHKAMRQRACITLLLGLAAGQQQWSPSKHGGAPGAPPPRYGAPNESPQRYPPDAAPQRYPPDAPRRPPPGYGPPPGYFGGGGYGGADY